ncbi:MAG: HYR domain-containing protein [Phycisphaerales bacterium]|nr:HYR domain-containing protein [Phycisphaerales bacterium]MCB9855610.1 HYR domain-containing protein [Phycisphaerales bacterium]MCB9864901.1 HYR domain-containing protein [Phycisphaerales bacterium]
MQYSTRIGILGLMAIIGSAGVLTGMGEGAPRGGMCDAIEICPTSQMSVFAENCEAMIPDLRDQVVVNLCNPGSDCYTVHQSPAPGTVVGLGDHSIHLSATICTNPLGLGNQNSNDNTPLGNDPCDGAVCFSADGDCTVTFTVNAPDPELVCTEVVADPIQLGSDCLVTVPDVTDNFEVSACVEGSYTVLQSPPAGTTEFSLGGFLTIDVFIDGSKSSCSVSVPVLPYTECPGDFTLFTGFGECTTSMPADLCDLYLPECQLEGRLGIIYSCRSEPPADSPLPVGDNEVRLIVEQCLGVDDCTEITELSCSLTITVEGPPPTLNCPEEPELDPLQIDANCMVTVPDLRDPDLVQACDGTEYELLQFPEPGSIVEVTNDNTLYVRVELSGGKGSDSCTFFVPLIPYILCPDSPQTVDVDENCQAVIPDLTDDVVAPDCCQIGEEQFRGSRCGEIRITQVPVAGTIITEETTVVITIERCFNFNPEPALEAVGDECIVLGTCTVIITPVDKVPPTIQCPAAVTLSADANCGADVPVLTPTVSDNCTSEAALVVTQDPAAGTRIGLGTTVVTLTVADEAGNTASCDVNVTVVDDTPPTITCPTRITIMPDENCEGVVPVPTSEDFAGQFELSDNCTPLDQITLSLSLTAETQLNSGSNMVTVTATDGAGNSASCTVDVFLDNANCLSPAPQPAPTGCDANNQSLNLLFSLLFHSPVCGATCPITVSMVLCGFLALRRNVRRRRR